MFDQSTKVTIELDDEVRWILGRPCFFCASTAKMLRDKGYEIAEKAEDEQAVAIFWMLQMYQAHGVDWRKKAGDEFYVWADEKGLIEE